MANGDAHHRRFVGEQEPGQCLGQLGLADAGRAEEEKIANRPVRVLRANTGGLGLMSNVRGSELGGKAA